MIQARRTGEIITTSARRLPDSISAENGMSLRLGLATAGADGPALIALVQEAERLGFDSTWCGESYGVDAVTRLACRQSIEIIQR